jgi:predicted RNA-binding protein with PIN domain
MTDRGGDEAVPAEVPDAVRVAVLRFAADVLGAMEPRDVPAGLRAVRRFAPRRRAEAGAGPLWAHLAEDGFRARVAGAWSAAHPDEAERLAAASAAPSSEDLAGDPVTAAAGAWLLRAAAWPQLAARVTPAAPPRRSAAEERRAARLAGEADRLRAELGVARAGERAARDELAGLQRELRRLRSDADRAREQARRAQQVAQATHDEAAAALDEARREREAAAADRQAAERERSARRAEVRAGQQLAQARTWLLLDTIVGAATGLRDELALPPVFDRPADLVVGPAAAAAPDREGSRGRSADDPALLDELLRLPHAHLVVDGYNVTKTGWPQLSLAEQRRRLVDGLALLATRTGAEVTCCFDGVQGPGAVPQPRGVRVLFSVGEIADDLIRRLVSAEPPGRALVVVTGDRAVAADVERAGARVLPSTTLLARLQRV